MTNLTQLEHKALEAMDNEAMTCNPNQRKEFVHQLKAYRNASIYADQWGLDADKLRATITRLTGVTKVEADAWVDTSYADHCDSQQQYYKAASEARSK